MRERVGGDLPAAGQDPQCDGQIERGRLLRQLGRGQIDHDPVMGPGETRVDDGPFDPMRAFLDRLFRQAHQHGAGQGRWRNVHFDLHRQRVNAHQGECLELG